MKVQVFLFVTIAMVILFSGCKKETGSPERVFYGTWVRLPADTIFFYNENGMNILKTKQSQPWFKPERQFEFKNDTLRLKDSVSPVAEFYPVNTFKWLQKNSSFEIGLADFYPVSNDMKVIYIKVKQKLIL